MPPYDCAIPPSHPDFSRENVSDSEFIALLLCQIKELEAENFKKDKRISELLHCLGEGSPEDASVAYAPQDDIPQRSARRRQQFEENERARSSKELSKNEIPESEPNPDTYAKSVPLSHNFKSGLSLAAKRSTSPVFDPEREGTVVQTNTSVAMQANLLESSEKAKTDQGSSKRTNNSQRVFSTTSENANDLLIDDSEANRSVLRTSKNAYNPRIRLPHTMTNQERTTKVVSSSESVSTPNATEEKRSLLGGHSGDIFRASKKEANEPSVLPQMDIDDVNDSLAEFKLNALMGFPESPSSKPIKTTQGSSFQILGSPIPEDDVTLLVKPEDFLTIKIEVVSTLNNFSKKGDDFNCTLAVVDRESDKAMWRVGKSFGQISSFDNEIRPVLGHFGLPSLPDKSLFSSTIPAKVDARKLSVQHYFDALFLLPHIPHMLLYKICRFISLDLINPLDDFRSGAKLEGFLIRRYKGLGTTWKVRWCQVDGPSLEMYEFPGGSMLEQIRLQGSQIGRQSTDNIAEEKGYRHAFLILESPRNKMSSSAQKHFFCAESDKERDEWVNAMVEYTDNDPNTSQKRYNELTEHRHAAKTESALAPKDEDLPKDSKEMKKLRKRSLFPFRYRAQQTDTDVELAGSFDEELASESYLDTHLASMNLNSGQMKPVFGIDVFEAVSLSSKTLKGRTIPSVCYRCLDFLFKTGAIYEEGIFRLSGSASTIRSLKDQFNREHDIILFDHPLKPDIHTVAGLFKTFLRELPYSIFGDLAYNELQRMVSYFEEHKPKSELVLKIRDFVNDVNKVKRVHFDFCCTVFGLLHDVVSQSSTNLMSLKNVCIVFVPTLRISLNILSLCITDFECIFLRGAPIDDEAREILDLQIPTF